MKKTRVTKVETFGRREKYFWVKKYILQYSNDETTWFNYSENGFVKVGSTPNIERLEFIDLKSLYRFFFKFFR